MTMVAADTPDGERLARVEVRLDSLDQQCSDIRADIREQRAEIREQRAEIRELLAEMQEGIRAHQAEMRDVRSDANKKFLWILGIMITMWISLFALITTFMTAIINKLTG